MRRPMIPLMIILSLVTIPAAYGEGSITYIDNPNIPDEYIVIHNSNSGAIQTLTFMLDETFEIPDEIYAGVILDECKEINAFYSSDSKTIIMCYELLQFIDEYAINNFDNINDISDASFAVATNILFHEAAHMLIDIYDLPVLGQEEDAADFLSVLMLISLTSDSENEHLPLHVALWFDYISKLSGDRLPFWDVHDLDQQRMFNTLCLIYGSDTNKFSFLLDVLPSERASTCEEEFTQVNESWNKLLEPNIDNSIMIGSDIELDTDPLPFDKDADNKITLKFLPTVDIANIVTGDNSIVDKLEYEIVIMRDGIEIFRDRFVDNDGMLELIIDNTDSPISVFDGEGFEDVYTPPYTISGRVFGENGSYTIKASIVNVEEQNIEPISEEFGIQVVPEFPMAMMIVTLSLLSSIIFAMTYKKNLTYN